MDTKVKFEQYAKLLKEWSKKMNLVAPSTLTDIEHRHFEDSAQLAKFISKDANIIDLGSGAGFPGVVLAILGFNVTCIESITKKTKFLEELKKQLELPNLSIVNDRIEKYLTKIPANTGNFVFTARAFAHLTKILDYVAHKKYRLFLLKGREINNEISLAKQKYKFDYTLHPSETGDGFILCINKIY
ncbi:MAG: 16S rRNA (guanine(527)-N(7))-methyltransferase RsmG [Alphaproteobacteria bacterium]|nr:16S rRNA (guanine(527)-N(7))-methyltransferase RsmG [Alphaproteobacteria bacterium]